MVRTRTSLGFLIHFSPSFRTPPSWRLNDNLLKDSSCLADSRQVITNFLADHSSDTTTLPCKWEAFKHVIRGVFISHRTHLKKSRSENISYLESVRIELTNARHELLRLFDQKYLCMCECIQRGFHEFGNKSGRWWFYALHPRPPNSHIMQLSSPSKGKFYKTKYILEEFNKYYSSLYSISGRYKDLPPCELHSKIKRINSHQSPWIRKQTF